VGVMSGTTCLVTGASSGIGKETALELAMLGATVVMVARDAARGAAAGAEITARVPLAQVEVITADLSSLAQVRRLAGDVLGRHGRLDVLVNNAGVISPHRRLTDDGLETTFASSPEVAGVTGRYFVNCKPAEPSALAKDTQAAARLWSLSEDLVGLPPRRGSQNLADS